SVDRRGVGVLAPTCPQMLGQETVDLPTRLLASLGGRWFRRRSEVTGPSGRGSPTRPCRAMPECPGHSLANATSATAVSMCPHDGGPQTNGSDYARVGEAPEFRWKQAFRLCASRGRPALCI